MNNPDKFDKYDCSGWVTKYGIECSDGLTLARGSFDHMDGVVVPLVFQHQRKDVTQTIGKTLLQARPEGVYGYSLFNATDRGQHAKLCVEHGDLDSYSIFAAINRAEGMNVKKGTIKEVSLVISGANPGAHIDYVNVGHADDEDDEAICYSGEMLDNIDGGSFAHADDPKSSDNNVSSEDKKTIKDIYNGAMQKLTETEQEVLMYVFGEVMDKAGSSEPVAQQSDIDDDNNEGGDSPMKSNAFENVTKKSAPSEIQQSAALEAFTLTKFKEAEAAGVKSFREYLEHSFETERGKDPKDRNKVLQHSGILDDLDEAFIQHDDEPAEQTYGIKNIDLLFPEATAISNRPEFINRRTEWVDAILTGTAHRPFAKIKSLFADITADEARAKGYTKGDQKDDEVFELLTRETYPQTVYKENRLDRDDVIDATTIDVIGFLKEEMRIKFDEEVARAMLIGDGRAANAKHKIKEDKIRPVLTDDDLFTIKYEVTLPAGATIADKADILLDESVLSFEDYDGSGNTVMFIDPTLYRNMLVLKDDIGNRKYKNPTEIAVAAGVNKILPCPYLKNLTRTQKVEGGADKVFDVHAITLDLKDYVFGSDKGGNLTFFDDFDINFNKMIYLMESRMSGALIKAKSAIVLETEQAAG